MKVIDFKKLAYEISKESEAHLQKLLESHNVKDDEEIVEFVYSIIDESAEFFNDDKMPSSWGKRACSSAMESLHSLMSNPKIKETLMEDMEEDDFKNVLHVLLVKKKEYMNIYKKEQRKKQKTGSKDEKNVNLDSDAAADILVDLDDIAGIANIVNKDSGEREGNDDADGDKQSMIDTFANVKFHRETCEVDGDMISKTCIIAKTKKIAELLRKYMSHEPDEFKVLFLEVIQDELENICN